MFGVDWAFVVLAIAVTFLLAGFVKGVIGMGLPTVAMGLLGALMPPVQAASLLVVPSLVTNVRQLAAGPGFAVLIRRLGWMMVALCVGTWSGSGLLTSDNAKLTGAALGIVLFLYGCTGFARFRWHVSRDNEAWLSPTIGFVTGIITGATGVFVIPAVPYLQALGLEKEQLIRALSLSFTISTVALALSLAGGGALQLSDAGASLFAPVPALGGIYLGQWVRLRISAETFRKVFFFGLLVLGAYLALRNLA